MIGIDITNAQSLLPVDRKRLRAAVCAVLEDAGVEHASISLAVVDDPAIARLNERFLGHPGPTDVLSFALEQAPALEGEVIVSAETAQRAATAYGWSPQDELLLYVIHGMLHLAGYDDATSALRTRMRRRERDLLRRFGVEGKYKEKQGSGRGSGSD